MLKVYCDGGCFGNNQNDKSKVKAYGSFIIEGVTERLEYPFDYLYTNNQAEYGILIIVLKLIDENTEAEINIDSKLVYEQLSGNWECKDDKLKVLYLKASQLLEEKPNIRLNLISGKLMKRVLGH